MIAEKEEHGEGAGGEKEKKCWGVSSEQEEAFGGGFKVVISPLPDTRVKSRINFQVTKNAALNGGGVKNLFTTFLGGGIPCTGGIDTVE